MLARTGSFDAQHDNAYWPGKGGSALRSEYLKYKGRRKRRQAHNVKPLVIGWGQILRFSSRRLEHPAHH